jgi:hypothetical protein
MAVAVNSVPLNFRGPQLSPQMEFDYLDGPNHAFDDRFGLPTRSNGIDGREAMSSMSIGMDEREPMSSRSIGFDGREPGSMMSNSLNNMSPQPSFSPAFGSASISHMEPTRSAQVSSMSPMGSAQISSMQPQGSAVRTNEPATGSATMNTGRPRPSDQPVEGGRSDFSRVMPRGVTSSSPFAFGLGPPPALYYDPHGGWPSGEIHFAHVLMLRDKMGEIDSEKLHWWRVLGAGAASPSMELRIHFNTLCTGETYDIGYNRFIAIRAVATRLSQRSPCMFQYISTGQRANGDPVVKVEVQPKMVEFALLESIARLAAMVVAEAQIFRQVGLTAVVLVFEELAKFFKTHRFDWDEQLGLVVQY